MTHDERDRPCESCTSNDDVQYCNCEGRYLCKECREVWEFELEPITEDMQHETHNHQRHV